MSRRSRSSPCSDTPARLLHAALSVFPADPDTDERVTVTGYEQVLDPGPPHERDPVVPERYWVPVLGAALPLAQAVTAAVLRAVAELRYATEYPDAMRPAVEQLRAIADRIERGDHTDLSIHTPPRETR